MKTHIKTRQVLKCVILTAKQQRGLSERVDCHHLLSLLVHGFLSVEAGSQDLVV